MKTKTSAKPSRLGRQLREHALDHPETTESFPWGEHAFKVAGKIFMVMNDGADGLTFSVKLPDSRDFALSLDGSEPTHYGMGAKGWVTLRPSEAAVPEGVLFKLIEESYRAIAPKKILRDLAEKKEAPKKRVSKKR